MKFQLSFLFLLAFGADAAAVKVTPTQKVLTLLQGMLEKGKAEKHAEQVTFAISKQFCDDTGEVKTSAIKEEDLTIGTLGAKIGKDGADVIRLSKDISALDKDENIAHGDMKAAMSVRAIERADYEAMHKDYSESIDAVVRAVVVLRKQTHDRSQTASLAQVSFLQSVSLIPETAKRAIDAFVQTGSRSEDDLTGAPEANGYEFQSNGVIDMLEKLQSKFADERTTLEREEANTRHSFEMLKQDLTDQIAQDQKDNGRKTVTKGKTLQAKAMKTSDRNDEVALETVDMKFLKDLKADCSLSASDFEARQQLRSEEIVAIEKAVEILSGDAVAGNAAKHLPSLLQTRKTVALSQLRFTANSQLQSRVATFLHARAEKFNSAVLEAVSLRASADPFSKVKKMIKDLVVRLMEEANQESDHKGWCDTELSSNKQTREEKTSAVQTLNADIDQLSASISKLSEDITDLTKAASDLSAAMASATKIRATEKAENAATVSDAQDAQTALAQALTVLKEFYARASEATSFLQHSATPYNGMADENGGVIGMLDVIESDFARLESETKAAEATSQKDFDAFMSDSRADKASKDTAVEHKKAKNQDATQTLTSKKNDLEGTQKELDAALTYYDKLKPSCVDSGTSYEDRVARRNEEVASLQEALQVMNGEDIA